MEQKILDVVYKKDQALIKKKIVKIIGSESYLCINTKIE